MLLKAFSKWWAGSKLQEETAVTQALVRRLENEQAEASQRINSKKEEYARQLIAHQDKRNTELGQYLAFLNSQLESAGAYVAILNNFQNLIMPCIESWMNVDLCKQNIIIINDKIKAIHSTISLMDAWREELNNQAQRQSRQTWREFTAQRPLTVTGDFITKTLTSIERSAKISNDDFNFELNRLKSHRSELSKSLASLRVQLNTLYEERRSVEALHDANKSALAEEYTLCIASWNILSKRFENYYAYELTHNTYADHWLRGLNEGGSLPEIIKVIGTATEIINCASEVLSNLNEQYQPYKRRVQAAHDTKNYPASFPNDKAEKKRLAPMVTAAFKDKKELITARAILFARREELKGFVEKIKPLHPDSAIESVCEMLSADRDFNAFFAFGFNTKKQKRSHWEKKKAENGITT
ncbi:hypothetical protein J1779_02380 [Rahnella sp. FC061912-K]|uniref:hypothetical protein n=1 Tax=Rahnella rivi TaxID=2816249 RepID=UPI001C279EF7|nr:hypothetical protein [Rahnella rivi]MBU9828774.1 hypothetical protein [Rahnella rivi]